MDPAFKIGNLPTSEGFINIRNTDIASASIIRSEYDDRIFCQTIIL